MISILIPVYNFDCTKLVNELRTSCIFAKINYEIILGNDASTDDATNTALRRISELPDCRVVNEKENIGRALICNKLSQLAAYPFLLFIDSDARVAKDDFIEKYLQSMIEHDVICGGIEVREEDLGISNQLRYKYEHNATKTRALSYRKRHPYEKFSTFNLLIRRSVFDSIRFSERCFQYGYEDTVLGLDLMKRGIEVVHIDNPLIHTGIDDNLSFLTKTQQSLHVLKGLDAFYQENIRISRTAFKLRRMHLLWLVKMWHRLFGAIEYKSLIKCPNLTIFNLYKLGYFCCIK